MLNSHSTLENVQDALPTFTPSSVMFKAKSTAEELKSRLVGGASHLENRSSLALTIVDIRAPKSFDRQHIKGAISVPFSHCPGATSGVDDGISVGQMNFV